MDLFKKETMKLATSLDWNAKCCKRSRKKKDTKLIHRNARRKMNRYDKQVEKDVIDF